MTNAKPRRVARPLAQCSACLRPYCPQRRHTFSRTWYGRLFNLFSLVMSLWGAQSLINAVLVLVFRQDPNTSIVIRVLSDSSVSAPAPGTVRAGCPLVCFSRPLLQSPMLVLAVAAVADAVARGVRAGRVHPTGRSASVQRARVHHGGIVSARFLAKLRQGELLQVRNCQSCSRHIAKIIDYCVVRTTTCSCFHPCHKD